MGCNVSVTSLPVARYDVESQVVVFRVVSRIPGRSLSKAIPSTGRPSVLSPTHIAPPTFLISSCCYYSNILSAKYYVELN